MSTTIEERTGYTPLRIGNVDCRAKLPASLWQALSVAERPGPWGEDINVVSVEDDGVHAAVISYRYYATLLERLDELERWIGECVQQAAGDQP